MNQKYRNCLLKVCTFEIIWKLFLFMLVLPMLGRIYRLVVHHTVFNQDILVQLLTFRGIAVMTFVLLLLGALVFYELSVLIQIIACAHEDHEVSLATIMKQSLVFPSLLRTVSLPICLIYFLLFLPFVHVGYLNSVIPQLAIPSFITQEYMLTWNGRLMLLLLEGTLKGLAMMLLFVPLLMVLKQESWGKALRDNFRLWKKLDRIDHLRILIGTGMWIMMERILAFLMPDGLLVNEDFNRFFLKNMMTSGAFRSSLLQYIVVTFILLGASVLMIQWLLTLAIPQEEGLKVLVLENEESRVDEKVEKIKEIGFKAGEMTIRWKRNFAWARKHPKGTKLLLAGFWILLILILIPDFIYLSAPILIVAGTLYFVSALVDFLVPEEGTSWLGALHAGMTVYRNRVNQLLDHWSFHRRHPKWVKAAILALTCFFASIYFQEIPRLHAPWVIGHRGSNIGPENSIESVLAAAAAGADYAEIDIQLTRDQVPVVLHDSQLTRLAGKNLSVSELTVEELKAISLTSRGQAYTVVSLEEMIEAVKEKTDTMGLMIELKPARGNTEAMVRKVIEVIEKADFESRCTFMSLDYSAVSLLKEFRPSWWVGYCVYGSLGELDEKILDLKFDFLAIEERLASVSFLEKAGHNWIPVYVWTVDDSKAMRQYLNRGVSGIITNLPDAAREEVDYFRKTHYYYYHFDEPGHPAGSE